MSDVKDKPFFEATDVYPDLYVDKVLFEYDYYSYYILIDKNHNYFVSHCYEVEEQQSWIINKIDISALVDFLCNKIDIRDIFLFNNEKKIIITRSYDDGNESYKEFLNDEIEKMDILPDEKIFIDVDEDEYKDYINKLKEYSLLKEKNVYSKKEHSKSLFTEYTIKELYLTDLSSVTDIKYIMLDKKDNSKLLANEYIDKELCFTDLFSATDKHFIPHWFNENVGINNEYPFNLDENKVIYDKDRSITKYFSYVFDNNCYEYNNSLRNTNSMSKNISKMEKISLLAIKN